MSKTQAENMAGAEAAAEVTGTKTERLTAYLAAVADVLNHDDYCTDTHWSGHLAFLRGYVNAALEDVA